ncbi:MAG: tetratricopeptide repeat protein [Sedimentisphaerales bacterium]|nr:tetratricopeptide repeat protein [Sedimentisphaerales bacterium]
MRVSVLYFIGILVAIAILAVVVAWFLIPSGPKAEHILGVFRGPAEYGSLTIEYPLDGTLFPPDICAPTFLWKDDDNRCDGWLVSVEFEGGARRINAFVEQPRWTPEPPDWEAMKKGSVQKGARVTIIGFNRKPPREILSASQISINTSTEPVGAPIFYREVNLPFVNAVKDPSLIRWRFGSISSWRQPPIVLEGMPVCGNCHSFSRSADTLAMDVDYANSKGSYVITRVAEHMTLVAGDVITWDDYRKEDGEQTFGLLSQISPDGRFVVSTVKDKSVFVPQPDLAFSQLFFPLKGILCVYDREKRTFHALAGADDPNYVQSNPTWSPDGEYIVFARTIAYDLNDTKGQGKVLLTREECREFTEEGKPFKFDLYRVPFNGGNGGKAEPIEGASNNGMSNYFAKYSPDGKWIVFCRAENYMLLQPDSELYIIPADGGAARRLRANTNRMNSWHSFSPNGKWLVFSSKAHSPYTQLFLTHIDEQGESTPAIVLSHFTGSDRAANIPEFVNAEASAIQKIREEFLDDYSYVRAGNEFFKAGDTDNAIEEYNNALQLNPTNATAHRQLGFLFYNAKNMYKEGMEHYRKAMESDPNDPRIHHDLGMALLHQRQFDLAAAHLQVALRGMPQGLDKQYNLLSMRRSLGEAMLGKGDFEQAELNLSEAVRIDPDNAKAHYLLAGALAQRWKLEQALTHYNKAVSIDPQIDTSAILHDQFAMNYAKMGRFREAVVSAEKALNFALMAQDRLLAQEIGRKLEIYKRSAGPLLKK